MHGWGGRWRWIGRRRSGRGSAGAAEMQRANTWAICLRHVVKSTASYEEGHTARWSLVSRRSFQGSCIVCSPTFEKPSSWYGGPRRDIPPADECPTDLLAILSNSFAYSGSHDFCYLWALVRWKDDDCEPGCR